MARAGLHGPGRSRLEADERGRAARARRRVPRARPAAGTRGGGYVTALRSTMSPAARRGGERRAQPGTCRRRGGG